MGHFRRFCRSVKPADQSSRTLSSTATGTTTRTIAATSDETRLHNEEVSLFASGDLQYMHRTVNFNGTPIESLVDTGASANILPRHYLDNIHGIQVRPSMVKVSAWGNFGIQVFGETDISISFNSKCTIATFIVVQTDINTIPLLSYDLCSKLNIIEFISNVDASPSPNIETILSEFDSQGVFSTSIREVKNISHKIEIDESVIPISSPARKLPPAILNEVKTELDKLTSDGIIRKIDSPTSWCSPIVIAKRKDNSIRLCTDLRLLNKAVKVPEFPIPDINDIFSQIGNASCYSLLDCASAFYQIPLDKDSQELLTFSTPFGRYCWQRIPYGLVSAPFVFQNYLSSLLRDVEGCFVFFDDILIATDSPEKHFHVLW